MNKKAEKAVIGHRVDSTQADTGQVAETLGLTKEETKIVLAYTSLIKKRYEKTLTARITAEAETHVRMRFPNNDEAINYMDQNEIEFRAKDFVEKSAFVFPTGNVLKDAPIDKAKTDFARASSRLMASPADPDVELSYAKALFWLAQMRVQQEYKDILSPMLQVVHHEMIGRPYMAPDETVNAVPLDDTLKTLMA